MKIIASVYWTQRFFIFLCIGIHFIHDYLRWMGGSIISPQFIVLCKMLFEVISFQIIRAFLVEHNLLRVFVSSKIPG